MYVYMILFVKCKKSQHCDHTIISFNSQFQGNNQQTIRATYMELCMEATETIWITLTEQTTPTHAHTLTVYSFKIHFNIIFPFLPQYKEVRGI
jgi:hypothetical protein